MENYNFTGHSFILTEALEHIKKLPPDIAVVETVSEYAAVSGSFIEYLRAQSIPYIALCTDVRLGFSALNDGAANMLMVPAEKNGGFDMRYFETSLAGMLRNFDFHAAALGTRPFRPDGKASETITKIIAIGASTGGSDAVLRILNSLPAGAPPVVAVMHMPPVFTKMYAERLDYSCKITVSEASDGDRLHPGFALIAKGDRHLALKKDAHGYYVSIFDGEKLNNHRPSIDIFFDSVAAAAGKNAVGVILTGMGSDGAAGITNLRKTGAFTIGQDEESSVVYGMPRVAYELGGVSRQASIDDIAGIIMENVL